MKIILSIFFGVGMVATMWGQDLNGYSYVKVPQKFEFLKEENQYQLNSLTAFLFEKYGFRVLFREDVPGNVRPCEVLQANVHSDSGLFRSKLYVTLENCKNETVFTSKTGVSREKDFKTSYHEALREAFTSVENLNYTPEVANNEVVVDPTISSNEIDRLKEEPQEVIVNPVVSSEEIEEDAAASEAKADQNSNAETFKEQKFTNGPVSYILRSTAVGFDLYKEGENEKFGRLLKSGGGDNYLYSSKNISGNAFFDTRGNLVVEYLDPNSGQLISVNYKLQP